MPKSIQELYGNSVRVRACGICVIGNKILMVNHKNLTDSNFWAPPGGGIEMNELAHEALEREFKEETNLDVKVQDLLFVSEFYNNPLHAIELFFRVESINGTLKTGRDPEMDLENQIITDARFISWDQITKIDPKQLHGIFNFVSEPSQIVDLRGYIKL